MAAANIPAAVRMRLRITLRTTIRHPVFNRPQNQPMRSSSMAPPLPGGLARMASAGFSFNTRRVPCRLPTTPQMTLIARPAAWMSV